MFSTCLPRFDTLAARPPTPPRDLTAALDQAVEFLDDSHEVERALKGVPTSSSSPKTTRTPERVRTLPLEADEDSTNLAKRVDFSPWPVFHEHGLPGLLSSPTNNTEKNTPSARDAKPIRSILKQSLGPLPPTPEELDTTLNYFSPQEPGGFLKMLQSVIHQLSSARQDQRLGAYLTLNGVLRAHEGVPDPDAMCARMDVLMQFISRDMVCKTANGNLDTNTVVQALNLAASIMYNAQLAGSLDDDFKTHLLDRSVHVLEQSGIPKQVMKIHIHILAHQNFHAGILTSGKVDRMLTALRTIEERCTGNTVIAMRLDIYKRLLVQAPKIMLVRIREWLIPSFYGMLSPSNDIRTKAIDTMQFAGLTLGTEPPASKAIRDFFDSIVKDDQTFFEYFVAKLEQMIVEKDFGPHVPQIWATVIFFFRNKRAPLEKWPRFKNWLMIIQRCLNSSEIYIRRQAMLSWNKLISAVLPDQSTSRNFFAMLRVPIAGGLEKRGTDLHAKQFRQCAQESFLYLLYFALRPGLTFPELDSAWDVYVAPTLIDMIKSGKAGPTTACQILFNLLSIKATGWNINVTSRTDALTMDELPRLDPRWTRSRAAKMVQLLEPIISASLHGMSGDYALVDAVLTEWLAAIMEAGTHEIKMSSDLKEAVAVLTNLLQRLWGANLQMSAPTDLSMFCNRFASLAKLIVTSTGSGPMNEDILTKDSRSVVEVAATPSSRHQKQQSEPHSSLAIVFGCLYRTNMAALETPVVASYVSVIEVILEHLLSAKSGGAKQIGALQRLIQLANDSSSSSTPAASIIWCITARRAINVLETSHGLSDSGDSQNLGLELRHTLSILSSGFIHANNHKDRVDVVMDVVLPLVDAMVAAAKSGAGSGGVVMAVIEPLAKLLVDERDLVTERKAELTIHIMRAATWPQNHHELDRSRKQLLGAGLAPQRSAVFDPYEHFYRLITTCLAQTYETSEHDTLQISDVLQLLAGLTTLLERCPSDILSVSLRKVQDGYAIWIRDIDRKTAADRLPAGTTIYSQIPSIWGRVLRLIEAITHKDSNLVRELEPLLVAGFSSPRKAIVNATILFWNESFGTLDTLEYPSDLEKVLRARLQEAEIVVPSFPDSHDGGDLPSLPSFFESQYDLEIDRCRPSYGHQLADPALLISRAPSLITFSGALQRPSDTAIVPAIPAEKGSTPRTKLRHEDSQIQFAPIDSSPLRYDESQLLTEHQKEINARQHENARMFADLSSSPMKLASLQPDLQQVVDFAANVTVFSTPPRHDADIPQSDDMPSSPTPSSTRVANGKFLNLEDMAADVDNNNDPPSSPPRGSDEEMDDTTVMPSDALDEGSDAQSGFVTAKEDVPEEPTHVENEECAHDVDPTSEGTNERAITPSAQLATTYEEAQDVIERVEQTDHAIVVTTPQRETRADNETMEVEESNNVDLSRVQDSFQVSRAKPELRGSHAHNSSPESGSKRKRASNGFSSARKRLSTLSRMASFLWGSQEQNRDEDDSDVGEEIVVASSQAAPSPPPRVAVEVLIPLEVNSAPTVFEDAADSSRAASPEQSTNRRRRSRKDATGVSVHPASQPEPRVTRSLKRRASSMEPRSATKQVQESKTDGELEPIPTKTRRSSRVLDKQVTQETVVDESERAEQDVETGTAPTASTSSVSCVTPRKDKSMLGGIASPLADRVILTPRRMLARLREVLVDLPKVVLGKDEEREFDDVLYQVRTQMHRAAARGDAQDIVGTAENE